MAKKLKTKGTLLQKQIATVYTTIAQRVKLDGPDASMGDTELTDLDSTMVQTGPTLVDPGTFSGTLWYDPNETTHIMMTTDLLAGTSNQYKLVYPDGDTTPANVPFTGFVSKFKPTGMESKGYLQAEFEIRCDGSSLSYVPGTP